MRELTGILFSVQKIFFAPGPNGDRMRYNEAIAYFSNLSHALREKAKHTNSFVFPVSCTFYQDRRASKNIIRANFSKATAKKV